MQKTLKNLKKSIKKAFFPIIMAVLAVSLSACIKNTRNVGYTFDQKSVDLIKPGSSNKEYVKRVLGSPSSTSSYGGEIWYYISTEYESVAFLNPKVKNQRILELDFGNGDVVKNINNYDASNAVDIKVVSDKTPTEGHEAGALGQILGNIGRFNGAGGGQGIRKRK